MKERDGLNIMRRNERRAEMKECTALSMLSGREHEAKTLQEAVEDSELLNFFSLYATDTPVRKAATRTHTV